MKIGVLVETHVGHRKFLKKCLESVRLFNPSFIVCSYNLNEKPLANYTFENLLPATDIFDLANRWVFIDLGMLTGSWADLEQTGLHILKLAEPDYVFSIEGDCILKRPEGIFELVKKLEEENADLIVSERRDETQAGCASYLAKTQPIVEIIDRLIADMKKGRDISGAEGRFGMAIHESGYKCLPVRNPTSGHFSYADRGTWGDILGFLHAHGTEKWRRYNHHKPLPLKYYDIRYVHPNDMIVFNEYWKTLDKQVLFKYNYWEQKPQTNYVELHGEEEE